MSGKYNIVAEQGATFNLNFRVETDSVAWDLSDYTFAMQVRRSSSSTTTLLNITSATMTSPGHVSVTVSAVLCLMFLLVVGYTTLNLHPLVTRLLVSWRVALL